MPVYCKSLNQTELSRLENLQYRATKLVTGAFHLSSKDKLNIKLGWETIQKRSDILSLNIFHKIHLHETRPLIRSCMPKLDFENKHNTRSKGGYIPFKNLGFKFKNSFSPHTACLWNSLPKQAQCKDLFEFKTFTNLQFKPERYNDIIILRGIDIDNNDFIQLNTKLTIAVQNFVLHTNRFS